MIVNGPEVSCDWRARLDRSAAIAYEPEVVVAMRTTLTPAAGAPVMAVVCGKNETIPWTSLVIGD